MSRRRSLSDTGVAALKPRAARYAEPDPELRGHYVRVTPGGAKSFVAVARNPSGKQVWATIGPADALRINEARDRARTAIQRIRDGLPAFEEKPQVETFAIVAGRWLDRHVKAKGLRSEAEITRLLDKHVLPSWRDREFIAIRRGDVAALLDEVEDDHGARQADYVLAIIRACMNWYAARHDDYQPPIARGMRRTDPKSRARDRVLDDDELRSVWAAAETSGKFGAMVQLALLTAQRREKLATMKWADVSVDGTWRVPIEDREKGAGGELVLPEIAIGIIRAQPRFASNSYVFPGRGDGHFNGFSPCKRALDKKLPGIEPWRFHDLRRTARSLMSRAGVRPEIAERVMGHVIAGVEGVYDRHRYRDEKAEALRALAGLIGGIVDPQNRVVPMARAEA
ncbi:tyrosine-type recombinase/integrase [Faunimonas sp. B44]|uniref:tyrosine-type recombinase/integrase n=1 Tax=Faunimonas sp. B44 TaxID=3461493 RepID=UPI004043F51C